MFAFGWHQSPKKETGLGGYGASELARDITLSLQPTINVIKNNIAVAQQQISGAITEINTKANAIYDNVIKQSQEFIQQANAQLTAYVQSQLGIVAADAEKTISELDTRTKQTLEQIQVTNAEWVNRASVLETRVRVLQDQMIIQDQIMVELEKQMRVIEQQKNKTVQSVW